MRRIVTVRPSTALAAPGRSAPVVWSAERFVEGAAATAKHAGMPSLNRHADRGLRHLGA